MPAIPLPPRPPTPTPEELDALAETATPEMLAEAAVAPPVVDAGAPAGLDGGA